MSLRSQFLFRLIMISILLVGGTSWLGYRDVRQETSELFDAQLARSARLMLSLARSQNFESGFTGMQEYLDESGLSVLYIDSDEDDGEESESETHDYEAKLAFQIWDSEGNLVVKSYNAPLEPITLTDNGYDSVYIDDSSWRTFSLQSGDGEYRCIAAERVDARSELIVKISNDLFYMFVILVPVLSLILYLSIDRGLKPLQRLASQINDRSGDNLHPITTDFKYTEINTIKNAVNRLFNRLNDALGREKRITSDAAHELRTPLAAIRLHAELAKDAERQTHKDESLEQVILGVDRATHLVEQLLILSRLEPELLSEAFDQVDLTALIIEECALMSPLALEKNIDIEFNHNQRLSCTGHEPSLRLLVRNLLSNAISYTPSGGNISIDLIRQDMKTSFVIQDDGPGVPEEERVRVLQRFYRSENHHVTGCGIGLSIVQRVVQIHQGTMRLCEADGGHGLKVVIVFNADHRPS